MDFKTDEIVSILKQQLNNHNADIDISEVGEITYIGDGVAQVSGLENVMSSELVELPNDIFGMALINNEVYATYTHGYIRKHSLSNGTVTGEKQFTG